MKLIGARQAWTDAQHESNTSISAVAAEKAESATKVKRRRALMHEVVFAALGDEYKEERIQKVRQRISIAETRRTPIGRSTARAAHLTMIGKILRAIDTLPFQVQQFGHYLYHPMMNMRHVLNAEKLITMKAEALDLAPGKRVRLLYLVTVALQSYKSEVHGGAQWGPARVSAEIADFYKFSIDQNNWNRDWRDLWIALRAIIAEVDIEAQQPVWQVIHAEKEESAA